MTEGAASAAAHHESAAIDYIPPPEDLRPYITTLFHFRSDEAEIEDIQPADVGKLMIVLKGDGEAHFRDGRSQAIPRCSLQSPTSVAVPFRFEGGFHSLGAALTPLGWAALSGLGADEHGNRIFEARDFFGPETDAFCDAIHTSYADGSIAQMEMVDRLSGFIRPRLKRVTKRHATLIAQVVEWLGTSLDPELDALYEQTAYSTRQTQRLVERYFGLNPRALKRKYRAVRAAAFLSAPNTTEEEVAGVTEFFYDQSHLIREINLFVGRTPSRLGGDDNPILNELLDLRNFRVKKPDGEDFERKT
ncbi:helix-turn-helix domain-containing protein [Erythrobacter litoralis]|uniref:HTH araC/xylS-type domain-containing protein n=1 Tax=Erythrobacter litoralis (strain HTCC2594) TaxID=314225 RepID=Q2N6P0_ERYLH|nr:AraC family transcriptional regulator [Erythrobacter litoralis]ABC64651.1 hypothetical protein ELI_12795 [Erythrobacter litoralis HTCC2594]